MALVITFHGTPRGQAGWYPTRSICNRTKTKGNESLTISVNLEGTFSGHGDPPVLSEMRSR